MKSIRFIFLAALLFTSGKTIFAQNNPPAPKPAPAAETDAKFAEVLSKNLIYLQQKTEVSAERRRQAYAKLLEGQRYIWSLKNQPSSQTRFATNTRLAKESLQKAVELNPALAEGYTALAELAKNTPPGKGDEAILLGNIAVKIEPNNFGGHQILAQLYTIYSNLNRGNLDPNYTQKAINEWKEVARLDPRNAEAFAFLSEFYARTNKPNERINALKDWLASVAPVNNGFYGRVFQDETLAPETASVKLGAALIENGQAQQAVEVLSRAIADDPENNEAVGLLREALETAGVDSSGAATQALRQAVFANPKNSSLVALLARTEAQAGKFEDASKIIRDATAKLAETDKTSAANLQIVLGDIYLKANRFDEAVAAYQNALTVRGIAENELVLDEERDLAIRVFDKMINAYKKANRPNDVKATIERARTLLDKNDLFADRELISFYREIGKKQEALQLVRDLRLRNADDYELLRLEATLLTDSGKVDEAAALVKSLIKKNRPAEKNSNKTDQPQTFSISSQLYDDFSNYLFISNLYSQAKRGKEAIEAANQAHSQADNEQKKQIAKLTLATAQQMSGDFKSAEETLRGLLKQTPKNPIALNNLGYFLAERNEKLDEALALIQQAVVIDPTNPSYLDSLGWAYFKLGKLDEAEKYLKMAWQYDASSSTILEHLGDVYKKQGKPELADSVWQKAINLASAPEEVSRLKSKLIKK